MNGRFTDRARKVLALARDEDCENCKTGSALKSIARSADGDEMIGKILPLILLSKLAGEMKNLGAERR